MILVFSVRESGGPASLVRECATKAPLAVEVVRSVDRQIVQLVVIGAVPFPVIDPRLCCSSSGCSLFGPRQGVRHPAIQLPCILPEQEFQSVGTGFSIQQYTLDGLVGNQFRPVDIIRFVLFNMLNNANVLTRKDPEKASQVLMKLSDLLRYQLYDSARDKVLLTSDIHFLEDFLNLEKVRRDNFHFMISKEGHLNGVQIPPLLFISFVENSVKHNNDSAKASNVNLFFDVRNDVLYFKCVNSKPHIRAVNSSGGLGLVNIKRRLALLFPQSHTLEIIDEPDTYCVTLTVNL